jgi:hypothetical protein
MKTPRELLFERNRSAIPHLDAARHRAIARLSPPATFRRFGITIPGSLRWAPLAAVWVCIGLMQWHSSVAVRSAEGLPRAVEREITLNVRANRQLLREAIGDSVEQPPRIPGPRTSLLEPKTTLLVL